MMRHRLHFATLSGVVALALITLAGLQGIATSSSHALAQYSLSKLPIGDQSLTLASNHILTSENERVAIERSIEQNLSSLIVHDVTHQILFHELSDVHGTGFYFGGVDGLKSKITITSGRFPSLCTPIKCEVLQIDGGPQSSADIGTLGLEVVGVAKLKDKRIFSGTYAPSPQTSVLVADGVTRALSLKSLTNLQGSNGWIATIDLAAIRHLGVEKYLASILNFQNDLSINFSGISLTWPEDALSVAQANSVEVVRKLGSLTFVVIALFISFLLLFSMRQKSAHQDFRDGLSRIGVRKATILQELGVESATPLFLGLVTASAISPLIPEVLAKLNFEVDLPQIYKGVAINLFLLLFALFLTITIVLLRDGSWKRANRAPALCALIIFAIYLILVNREFGSGIPLTWLAPLGLTLIATVFSYLLFNRMSFLWRRRNAGAFLINRENLGTWQSLTSIIALAVFLAVASLSFASGIDQKVIQQSSDQVPLDLSLSLGASLVRPLDLASISDYQKLQRDAAVFPVLRIGSSVRGRSAVADSVSIIGLPEGALANLRESDLRKLGSVIRPINQIVEPGIPLGNSNQITFELQNIPPVIDLVAWFRSPAETHQSLTSLDHGKLRSIRLSGQIPAGSTLVAIELRETSEYLSRRLHAIGEGTFSVPVIKGVGAIRSISLDSREKVPALESWGLNDFAYIFDGGPLLLRPRTVAAMPTIITDPATAALANDGVLTLSSAAEKSFKVHIGSIRAFFPSAGERYIVMDLGQLQRQISQVEPGAVDPIEIWISTQQSANFESVLRNSGFSGLRILSQAKIERELRAEPVRKGLYISYLISLIFALLLALIMHLSALPLITREKMALLEYMEMQGSTPSGIRSALRSNLRATLLLGLSVGLCLGVLTSRLLISNSIPGLRIFEVFAVTLVTSEIIGYYFTKQVGQ
jgi:hypothetical protein